MRPDEPGPWLTVVGGEATEQTMPALPPAVRALRGLAREFAAARKADPGLQEDVALAVSEAVTNVVRHAYPTGEPGVVHFSARAAGRGFEIVVSDRGQGFRAGCDAGLGIGLKVVAQATADFRIEARDPGTMVVMHFLLAA